MDNKFVPLFEEFNDSNIINANFGAEVIWWTKTEDGISLVSNVNKLNPSTTNIQVEIFLKKTRSSQTGNNKITLMKVYTGSFGDLGNLPKNPGFTSLFKPDGNELESLPKQGGNENEGDYQTKIMSTLDYNNNVVGLSDMFDKGRLSISFVRYIDESVFDELLGAGSFSDEEIKNYKSEIIKSIYTYLCKIINFDEIGRSKDDTFFKSLDDFDYEYANKASKYDPNKEYKITSDSEENRSDININPESKGRDVNSMTHSRNLRRRNELNNQTTLNQIFLKKILEENKKFFDKKGGRLTSDLSGMDFSGMDLHDMDLSSLKLNGTVFNGANLSGVKLFSCKLDGAQFLNADLSNAVFQNSTCQDCNFQGTDLSGTDFGNSDLSYSSFRYAKINGSTKLDGANTEEVLWQ